MRQPLALVNNLLRQGNCASARRLGVGSVELKFKLSYLFSLAFVLWILCCSVGMPAYAATAAGSIIHNQASASYRDGSGRLRTANSNIVQTLIQQVASVQLHQDQAKQAVAGQHRSFTHRISNTGNGPDRFTLTIDNDTGGDFNFSELAIYADANQDGQPDSLQKISSSPTLAAGEHWHIVISGLVSAGVAVGESGVLTLEASSNFNASVSVQNQDTVTISGGAAVSVYKQIDATSGTSPGGPFTVTLRYHNSGIGPAQDLVLIDTLPIAMRYVAGSARWSVSADTVLSDSDPQDLQAGTNGIRYCAYHVSCSGLPESLHDTDSLSDNQVTAVLVSVPAGTGGSLSFDVTIEANVLASSLFNTAEYEYLAGAVSVPRGDSNTVAFEVTGHSAVVFNGSSTHSADFAAEPVHQQQSPQGAVVRYPVVVWNTGNRVDTFDLTLSANNSFPVGTQFRFLYSDGLTPLADNDASGTPDTGPLAAGAHANVMIEALLPLEFHGDNNGAGFAIDAVAQSVRDASVSNPLTATLGSITEAQVNITNAAAISDSEALGVGFGPEPDAVTQVDVMPGDTAQLILYINNIGSTAASFELLASFDAVQFDDPSLAAGVTVEFFPDDEPSAIGGTGLIDAGDALKIRAMVAVPKNMATGELSIYFRAYSASTGAFDIVHDSISVGQLQSLSLTANQNGNTEPGGSVIYQHSLRNEGNTELTGIDLMLSDSLMGWSSAVYRDSDGDGVFSAEDQLIDSLDLAVAESVSLFVKVFSPATASGDPPNSTTLLAQSGNLSHSVSDVTSIGEGEVHVTKEQAPDYGCDGVLDDVFSIAAFSIEPGNNCVQYRLTASNSSAQRVYNVSLADATPIFTVYAGVASCSATNCSVDEPPVGSTGDVVASVPLLPAGETLVLLFSVRID